MSQIWMLNVRLQQPRCGLAERNEVLLSTSFPSACPMVRRMNCLEADDSDRGEHWTARAKLRTLEDDTGELFTCDRSPWWERHLFVVIVGICWFTGFGITKDSTLLSDISHCYYALSVSSFVGLLAKKSVWWKCTYKTRLGNVEEGSRVSGWPSGLRR